MRNNKLHRNLKKYLIPYCVLIFNLLFLINSCSDNPEGPNNGMYNYDQPRFNWQSTYLPGEWIYSQWSPDTNEVLMTTFWDNYLLHFKDGNITRINYASNVRLFGIDGLSRNEAYLAGWESINGKYKPRIERWNGSSLVNMPINYNFNDDILTGPILVKSSSEIWISAAKGLIYNFDGYNLTKYQLPDTLMQPVGILYDENNKLRYLTHYLKGSDTIDAYYVYEFNGSNWLKVYQDSNFPFSTRDYGIMNTMIYACDVGKMIYKLENNTLVEKIPIPQGQQVFNIYAFAGNSFENLMGFGSAGMQRTFFHWNGQKWSNEQMYDIGGDDLLWTKMVNDNYFYATNSGSGVVFPALYRAFKKQ